METVKTAAIERWDASTKQLISERRETLSDETRSVEIYLKTGRLLVENSKEGEPSTVLVRTIVKGNSEKEARELMEKEAKFSLKKDNARLLIEDESEGVSANIGGVILGNVSGNIIIGSGRIVVNGQEITGRSGGRISVPDKEVVLKISATKNINYNLRNDAGSINLDRATGKANLATTAGEIKIKEFNGELRVDSTSGDAEIESVKGELSGSLTSGDLGVRRLDGSVNLRLTSGDIEIRELLVTGRANRVEGTSGDISIGIENKNLRVKAQSTSGDVDVDRDNFVVTRESKPKGRSGLTVITTGSAVVSIGGAGGKSSLEGHYGEDSPETPELMLSVTSGDIEISRNN